MATPAMFGTFLTLSENAGTIKYTWTVDAKIGHSDSYFFTTPIIYSSLFGEIMGAMRQDPVTGDGEPVWLVGIPGAADGDYIFVASETISCSFEITATITRKAAVNYPTLGGDNGEYSASVFATVGREVIGKYGLSFVDFHGPMSLKAVIGGTEYNTTFTPTSPDAPIDNFSVNAEIGASFIVDVTPSANAGYHNMTYYDAYDGCGCHGLETLVDMSWSRSINGADRTCRWESPRVDEKSAVYPPQSGGDNGYYIETADGSAILKYEGAWAGNHPPIILGITDYSGAFAMDDEPDLANIDDAPRTSTITGRETTPYIDDSGGAPAWYWRDPLTGDLKPFGGYPVTYTGSATIVLGSLGAGYVEEYNDTPEPLSTKLPVPLPQYGWEHGWRTIDDISPTMVGGEWQEGSMHEPMPWSAPNPDGGDCYSLMYSDSASLHEDDALVLSLAAPGSVLGIPLDFTTGTYTPTNCTVSKPGNGTLKISTSGGVGEAARTGVTGLYFFGGRFARVYWSAPVGAKARLWLGGKNWLMEYKSGQSYTEIDLCLPDGAAGPDVAQSIAPIAKPLDVGGHGIELPALWGVGYVADIKVELLDADTDYFFARVDLIRKSVGDGGFARLLVSHANGPWNDVDLPSREDFAFRTAGYLGFLIPKAYLIVDGAVVWELIQGLQHPDQHPIYYKLTRPVAHGGVGLPLDNYDSPTKYPVYGLTVLPKAFAQSDTKLIDSFCLVGLLDGGEYTPDGNNQIKVGLTLRPEYWRVYGACDFRPTGSYHRFRSTIFGLIYNHDGTPYVGDIKVKTAHDDTVVVSNSLGFYHTPALYNRYPGRVSGGGTGHLVYDPATGHLAYDPASGHLIYDSGKIETVEMRSRLQSRLSLRKPVN